MLYSSSGISIMICRLSEHVLMVFHPSQAHGFESHKHYITSHPFKPTFKVHRASILDYCTIDVLCCNTNPGHSIWSEAGVWVMEE